MSDERISFIELVDIIVKPRAKPVAAPRLNVHSHMKILYPMTMRCFTIQPDMVAPRTADEADEKPVEDASVGHAVVGGQPTGKHRQRCRNAFEGQRDRRARGKESWSVAFTPSFPYRRSSIRAKASSARDSKRKWPGEEAIRPSEVECT